MGQLGVDHFFKAEQPLLLKDNFFLYRNALPHDGVTDISNWYCTSAEDGSLHLKNEHNYMYQVQAQMGITGLEWVDFVVYTKKSISVERICFDSSKWYHHTVPKLEAFYKTNLVPEFFTGRVKRNMKLY